MKRIFFFTVAIIFAKNLHAQNVGIGTNAPADKLSVVTALPGYGITHTYGSVTMGTYISNLYGQFGTKTNHPLQFFTNNGAAQVTLLQNGNVGIGTINTNYKLDVVANTNVITGLRVKNTASTSIIDIDAFDGNASLRFYHDGDFKWAIKNSPQDNFEIYNSIGDGSVPKFTIDNATGKIGFHTLAPQSDLHINPNGAGSILIGTDKNTGGYTTLEMGISQQSAGYSYLQSTQSSGTSWGKLALNPNGGNIGINYNSGGSINSLLDINQNSEFPGGGLRLKYGAQFWDLLTGGQGFLYFQHNNAALAYISTLDGSYNTLSDFRFKKNINKMGNVLDKVMSLQPKTYQFKVHNPAGVISTGFIAQEVMPLFPELVSDFMHPTSDTTDNNIYHGINYAGFSVIAIKAIQEQQLQIEAATEKNNKMMLLIEKMQLEIAALQNKK
jgi:hypothetical protein